MRYGAVLFLSSWLCVAFGSYCSATMISYGFSASFASPPSPVYNVTIPMGSQIDGRFVLDSQAVGVQSPNSPNVVFYRHVVPEGFRAKFGSLDIRASNYVVIVSNNVPYIGNTLADIINIRWASDIVPALDPLHVNSPFIAFKTTGSFSINLVGNQNLFSDTSLPANLNLSSFFSKLSFLADATDAHLDLLYNVSSLTPAEVHLELPVAPEPNSFISLIFLFLLGQFSFAGSTALRASPMRN